MNVYFKRFPSAPSVQNGWSRALGVNLLVAGHHRPERSKLGSGIYLGQSDLTHNIVYDSESGNRLLISNVKSVAAASGVIRKHVSIKGSEQQQRQDPIAVHSERENFSIRRDHLVYHDDLSNYTQTLLLSNTAGEKQAQACHEDGLCCSLTYTNPSSLTYSLLAYSGIIVQGFHDYRFYSQVCTVLWCESEDINSCAVINEGAVPDDSFGPFSLTGTFTSPFAYPALFDRNLSIASNDLYDITVSGSDQTMSTQVAVNNLMTAGFFARWYDKDP